MENFGDKVRRARERAGVSQLDLARRLRMEAARFCRLKSFFGVSAEFFIIRLEELGLIEPHANQRLRAEIKAYYESHFKAMEPKPCLAESGYDMRLGLLAGEE